MANYIEIDNKGTRMVFSSLDAARVAARDILHYGHGGIPIPKSWGWAHPFHGVPIFKTLTGMTPVGWVVGTDEYVWVVRSRGELAHYHIKKDGSLYR